MSRCQLDTVEDEEFMELLTNDLLGFGKRFPSPEGSSYYLGDDGTPWTERPRETWITCRMAHVYSIGSMLKGDESMGSLVDAALKGLQGELKDKANKGWYPGVNADGSIIADKQCYAHAFVILAATSALLAGRNGAKELLDEALKVYDEFFWNEEEGLAADTWNTEFTVKDSYRGLNANMHTVEAFLAVADAAAVLKEAGRAEAEDIDGEKYRSRAGRIIAHVAEWSQNNSYRIPEHFTSNWDISH